MSSARPTTPAVVVYDELHDPNELIINNEQIKGTAGAMKKARGRIGNLMSWIVSVNSMCFYWFSVHFLIYRFPPNCFRMRSDTGRRRSLGINGINVITENKEQIKTTTTTNKHINR